jgi:hypothetical protein
VRGRTDGRVDYTSCAVYVGDDYNDEYDDDDDEYRTCLYNLVVHPPALAICVHLLPPAGFPAGLMNILQYNDCHRLNACSSPGQKSNPQHVYHSGVPFRSHLLVCLTFVHKVVMRIHSMCITAEFLSAFIFSFALH